MRRVETFSKPAYVGSVVPYHQDNAYFNLTPPDSVTCWIALDDSSQENGCVYYARGSHREGLRPHKASAVKGNSMMLCGAAGVGPVRRNPRRITPRERYSPSLRSHTPQRAEPQPTIAAWAGLRLPRQPLPKGSGRRNSLPRCARRGAGLRLESSDSDRQSNTAAISSFDRERANSIRFAHAGDREGSG